MGGFDKTITSTQRQGSYGGTRYHGKYSFGTTGYNPATMTLTTATLYLTATASGKSAARALYLRAGQSTSSTLITKSNGNLYDVNRDTENTINLLNSLNSSASLQNGNFGIYVSSSDDNYYFTDSTGEKYSTHYIKFSKARLVLEWVYKNGSLKLNSTTCSVGVNGQSLSATINNYQSGYYYKAIVIAGNAQQEYELGSVSSFNIDFADSYWQNQASTNLFANASSILGTITLRTYSDSAYATQLGSDSTVSVTLNGTGLSNPFLRIDSIKYSNVNPYTNVADFAIPAYGTITLNYSASAYQGASIVERYISASSGLNLKSINSSNVQISVSASAKPENNIIQLIIKDSRGVETSVSSEVNIQSYWSPKITFESIEKIIDTDGKTQVQIIYSTNFFPGASFSSGQISISEEKNSFSYESLESSSGTFITSFEDGVSEKEHFIQIQIQDTMGGKGINNQSLASDSFYLFYGVQRDDTNTETGISLGIGGTAPNESNAVRCYWDLQLDKALGTKYGGTGVTSEDGLKKLIGNLMYPIGSIYMSTSSTNPSSIFGGNWVAWGAGRVPVGVDTSNSNFNTVEKTGGSTDAIVVQHNHVAGYKRSDVYGAGDLDASYWKYLQGAEVSYNTSTVGEDGTNKNLQPYITCYMWKRIS